jgi:cytidylate kinase
MPIVTISRGTASGGKSLADELAQKMGFDVVSREEIVRAAAEFGVPEEKLHKALLEPPKFWDRFQHDRRRYMAFVQAALAARVQQGRVIYHGNAGHLLLRGISHVACFRLIAPMEYRVRTLREQNRGISQEEAARRIEHVDRQRREWTHFLYGVDWLDPGLYDLCINLRTLDLSDAVEIAAAVLQCKRFEPTQESAQAMANLVLASRVRAALAADPRTAFVEVDVRAGEGEVSLKGRLRQAASEDAVIEVVAEVEGVVRIDHANLGAPDYTV